MTAFTEGSFVAIVSTHWNRRIEGKRTIHKVHKNGNFTLLDREGKPSAQQYRPNYDGKWAHRTGQQNFMRSEHLEPWTPAIEDEIRQRQDRRRRDLRRDVIIKALTNADVDAEALTTIEGLLKLDVPTTQGEWS